MSTGLVALIAYLYALVAGYVATPPGVAVGVVILSTLSLVFMVLSARAIYLRNLSGARPLLYLGFVLFIAMTVIDLTREQNDTLWDRIAFHWTTTLALAGITVAVTSTLQMRADRSARSRPAARTSDREPSIRTTV